MKLSHGIGLVGCLAFLGAGAVIGCSGDDSSPNAPASDAGKDGTTVTDSSTGTDTGTGADTSTPVDDGSTGDSSTGDDGGSGDAGPGDAGPTPDCTTYCTKIAAACKDTTNIQYKTTDECMTACKYFAVGTGADQTGNTLGCRINHAILAATTPNPHCWHAGPFGYGVCGAEKDSFCALAVGYCSADAGFNGTPPYASLADCLAAVPNFARADAGRAPGAYTANGPGGGNTLDCREYHLNNALQSTALQGAHCTHPAANSGPCQ